MKPIPIFILLILMVLAAGCSPSLPLQASPSLSTRSTLAVAPIETSLSPTAATLPADTSLPQILTLPTGPAAYDYLRRADGGIELVALAASGRSQQGLRLPAEVDDPDPANSLQSLQLSPGGKWLAFYTGSAGDCGSSLSPSGTYGLALNLVNLSTNTVVVIANLLPSDYPLNFQKNAQDLIAQGTNVEGLTEDSLILTLQNAFLCGIHSLSWSPDGSLLAFAGAMDGPSSDTYLYDTLTQKIRRLSSGPEEVQWLKWSPDGNWILQGGAWQLGEGMSYDIYASSRDGATVETLSKSTSGIVAWLNDTTYLEYDSQNGPGNHNLRAVNVQTGEITNLWKGSFGEYAIDPKHNRLAVSVSSDPNQAEGSLYLVNLSTGVPTKIKDGVWMIGSFPVGGSSFFIEQAQMGGQAGDKYILGADGSITTTDLSFNMLSVAPDGQQWLSLASNTVTVYSGAATFVREVNSPVLPDNNPDFVTWNADASSFFIGYYEGSPDNVSSYSLVRVDLADGKAVLIDQSPFRLSELVPLSNGK